MQCPGSSVANSAVTVTPSQLNKVAAMTGNESGSTLWELKTVLLQYIKYSINKTVNISN